MVQEPGPRDEQLRRAGFRTVWRYVPSGAPRRRNLTWVLQRLIKIICWAYLRLVHDFRFRYHPEFIRDRPYIAVFNHTSVLDVPALIAADPFDPPTTMIVKSEMVRVPVLGAILTTWGAVPADRRGRDVGVVRQIKRILADGRGICIAPSGTRSVDGRLGPISPVLLRLILQSDVAVFPVVIIGAAACLPKGAKLPRPGQILIDTGPEIDLREFRGRRLSDDEFYRAARAVQDSLAALLPEPLKPDPSRPVLGTYTVAEGKDAS